MVTCCVIVGTAPLPTLTSWNINPVAVLVNGCVRLTRDAAIRWLKFNWLIV
jgi:hypothetical protein